MKRLVLIMAVLIPVTLGVSVPASAAPRPSTCAKVREAILTGTQRQIDRAMAALIADRKAPIKAREYARRYLADDGSDPDFRELYIQGIQLTCSV